MKKNLRLEQTFLLLATRMIWPAGVDLSGAVRVKRSSSRSQLAVLVCFMTPHHPDGHANVLRTASRCQDRARAKHTHRAYLDVYSVNPLSLFGCLGNEDAAGLSSPSSIHQAADRDGRGSAAGQRLASYSPSRIHAHTQGARSTACRHALRCMWDGSVCVFLRADMPNEHPLLSLAQSRRGGRDANKRKI